MTRESLKRGFARRIWQIGAFADMTKSPGGKGFRLKKHEREPNALLSPFYFNYRLLQSDHSSKFMAVSLFERMLGELDLIPDCLAAIPEAIVPIVSTLSDRTGIPMITPRAAKGHGSGSKVDGIWKPGMTATLFDDVVTGADSKLEAHAALEAVEIKVEHVFVLTDRQQGGEKQLAVAGLRLHAAFTIDEMLKIFLEENLLDEDMFLAINTYRMLEAS